MSWLGIDDTDSPGGGCTTFALTEVLRAVRAEGWDLLGEPRLVRLNPNIPYKTRGNAALAARIGRGRGRARTVGQLPDGPVRSYADGVPLGPEDEAELFEVAWKAVLGAARSGEPGTDPALVVAPRRLPSALYWRGVQTVVPIAEAERLLTAAGARFRALGSRQGLVGAAAAVAWPGAHPTWELISYRGPGREGLPRRVEPASVRRAQRSFPELFLCEDPTTRRILVAPHTPCPILFGLRATRPGRLAAARRLIRSEPVERWLIFRTNQGSGDHLSRTPVAELGPFGSTVLSGEIDAPVEVGPGGHARFSLRTPGGALLRCVAFEPTKTLPRLAARLRPGDRIRVWGGRATDEALRLEGIEVLRTVRRRDAGDNPVCPRCGRAMPSLGRGRGFRCPTDHVRRPPEARSAIELVSAPARGRYHPTPSARRHLHPRAPEPGRPGETTVRWWRRPPRTDL